MEQERVSIRLKGKLARWYKTLDNKSYHAREAFREHLNRNNVNIENYKLKKEE